MLARNIQTESAKGHTARDVAMACGLAACLLAAGPATTQAESQGTHFQVPDNLVFYNPLTSGREGSHWRQQRDSVVGTLDNLSLELWAADIRNNEMADVHRALNHQWIQQHQEGRVVTNGGRALSRIIQTGFKTYWNRVKYTHFKDNQLVPNAHGNGKLTSDLDYHMRINDDKVDFNIKYTF